MVTRNSPPEGFNRTMATRKIKDSCGLVSVVIPTYDRAQFIIQALDSVFRQSYRPLELIIVDDGSKDNTSEVVTDWANSKLQNSKSAIRPSTIDRIVYKLNNSFSIQYILQNNAGAPTARNYGFELSTGEFIQWWDSDDLMHPNKIQLQVNALKDTTAQWSGCLMENGFDNMELLKSLSPSTNFIWGALCTQSGLYRRRFVQQVGQWNPELEIMQDSEFCFRVLCSNPHGVWIPKKLGIINLDGPSIMRQDVSSKARKTEHSLKFIESIAVEFKEYDDVLKNNIGKIYAYYYRRLALIKNPNANRFYHNAKARCISHSALRLALFRLIEICRLTPLLPKKFI